MNRVAVRARIDPTQKRIDLDQGDFSRVDTRPSHNVGIAVTGSLDFSGEPHLAFGVAGTRMPMSMMKRLWPVFAAADVREWVESHIDSGTVERVVIAGNAALMDFKKGGPPTPEDGLSVDIETSGTTLRPVDPCRPFAMPISMFTSPAAQPPSISAAAPSRWSRDASSISPAACSKFPIPIRSRRRRGRSSGLTARFRRRRHCWRVTPCVAMSDSRSIPPRAAARFPRR